MITVSSDSRAMFIGQHLMILSMRSETSANGKFRAICPSCLHMHDDKLADLKRTELVQRTDKSGKSLVPIVAKLGIIERDVVTHLLDSSSVHQESEW